MFTEKRILMPGVGVVKARFDAKGQMHWCSHWHLLNDLVDVGWVRVDHHRNGWNASTVFKN